MNLEINGKGCGPPGSDLAYCCRDEDSALVTFGLTGGLPLFEEE